MDRAKAGFLIQVLMRTRVDGRVRSRGMLIPTPTLTPTLTPGQASILDSYLIEVRVGVGVSSRISSGCTPASPL